MCSPLSPLELKHAGLGLAFSDCCAGGNQHTSCKLEHLQTSTFCKKPQAQALCSAKMGNEACVVAFVVIA